MTVKLRLPPGFFNNGTSYAGAGRYINGDLVRWVNGFIQPINGWRPRNNVVPPGESDPIPSGDGLWNAAEEAARSGVICTDSVGGVETFVGTNSHIYRITNSNVVTDVTPTEFVAQAKDAVHASGYGRYRYGSGQYGTQRPTATGRELNAFSWGFDHWGSWPVAVARGINNSPVFVKRPNDALFVPMANSPTGAFDVLSTDERFIMTIGKRDNYRLIEWSEREDFETWTSDITNQAGSFYLQGNGRLVRAVRVLNQILIIGENDAFTGRYVGPPYVYGFNGVGKKCGIIGPEAIAVTADFAIWIGGANIWMFDGTVKAVPCEVSDYYKADHDDSQRSKTTGFTLHDFAEVWFLYQSKSSTTGEPDSYLVYNWEIQKWYYGRINRTLGFDSDPFVFAMMIAPNGALYDHEVSSAGRDGRVPFIETGPLESANGNRLLGLSYVYPDNKNLGDARITLSVRDNARDAAPRFSRDFALTNPVSTMGIMGRDIRMKIYGAGQNPNWTVGDFRVVPLGQQGPQR